MWQLLNRLSLKKAFFINCPFDELYRPLFQAIVFTVMDCGSTPRCALEISNAAQTRLDKILEIIDRCKLGLHDISRTELSVESQLPRFNMPFELGLFLACRRFGGPRHKDKNCIVFDRERFRYQTFLSDISGQDIDSHQNDRNVLIRKTRDWLRDQKGEHLPGGGKVSERYESFTRLLPQICSDLNLQERDLSFSDLVYAIKFALERGT